VLPERYDLQEAINFGREHEDPSYQLLDATEKMEVEYVPLPHTPAILVFDDIVGDTYRSGEGNVSKVVRGQYRVKSIEETNANFDYVGDVIARPKNIAGWKVVHLEPVAPEDEIIPDYTDQGE
jgi:hypothetical protein